MSRKLRPQVLTGRNKLARAVWELVWLLLFRPSPRIFHSWRCMLARLFGARLGKRIRLYPSARIWAPWNLTMEDHSCLGPDVDCYCVDKIQIGHQAVVSQYSYLCTASHDYRDRELPLISAPILIGAQAWVTADVFVGPGVTIGEGAVVTARSSVFGDIPPWVVARGNPATPYKERTLNSDEQRVKNDFDPSTV
ncbi:WcaF family extracellular polysaccharide biosynthesis acetyltransferase [Thiocystis violacea]|uniref:WcaF family extracellular polysaccharide biosynthesis acetyltransferase n=1 Tax=Thiocystis violacea TaxID=13725 RepID=UPI0019036A14|nr:WcaF family extracellular polysaccharide biosynthesis acetyltransferase [Thiocystis violacea]MBK1718331.1 colanic acid biosynthesis acetyltransferase WcaF [Thiocystis violacea]